MADRDRDRDRDRPYHQLQVHPQKGGGGGQGPSTSQVVAVVTLLPVSGTLLALAGLTLVGSAIGLIMTTPLFILFSPVIVPAAILLGLAVTGFLSSGAMGLTGLSALSKVVDYLHGTAAGRLVPEHVDQAKRRMQDMAGHAGQKTKETGQMIQGKAQEGIQSAYEATGAYLEPEFGLCFGVVVGARVEKLPPVPSWFLPLHMGRNIVLRANQKSSRSQKVEVALRVEDQRFVSRK
ncbi:hypothetical protein Ancab_031028 [Ancistrocladus abbreviatus]